MKARHQICTMSVTMHLAAYEWMERSNITGKGRIRNVREVVNDTPWFV